MEYDKMNKGPLGNIQAIIGNRIYRGNVLDYAMTSDLTMSDKNTRIKKLLSDTDCLITNIWSYLEKTKVEELRDIAWSVSQAINSTHIKNRKYIDGIEESELRRYIEWQLIQQYRFVDGICKNIMDAQLCDKYDANGIIPDMPSDMRDEATDILGNPDLKHELSIEYYDIGKAHEQYRMNIIDGKFPENNGAKIVITDKLLEYSDILRRAEEILALEKILGKYGVDITEITIPRLEKMTRDMSDLDNSILSGLGINDEQIMKRVIADDYSENELVDPVYVSSMDPYRWFLEGIIQLDMDREKYDAPEFRYKFLGSVRKYDLALKELDEMGFVIEGVPEAPIIFEKDKKGPMSVWLSDDDKYEQHLVERKVLNQIISALTPEKQKKAKELTALENDIVDVFCEIRYRRVGTEGLPIMLELANNGI